ncbi:MAG TPA: HAMP domain-containing sensor histidine kinase [Solirubrobacteraceae bacterium]|jgi:two-component system sensor histidine kinase MprB|nr:HAMP domain-containing sensor histidine kinase [Solirubrobacteraceae bacterium]
MSFRRRVVLLAAGAVATAVVIASAVVYVVTSHELSGQLDASLTQKITPGGAQAVKIQRVVRAGRVGSGSAAGEGNVKFELTDADGRVIERGTASRKLVEAGVVPKAPSSTGKARSSAPLPLGGTSSGVLSGSVRRLAPTSATPSGPGVPSAGARVLVPDKGLGQVAGYVQLFVPGRSVLRSEDIGPGLPVNAATRAVAEGRRGPFFSNATIAGTKVRTLTSRAAFGGVWQVALPLTDVNGTLAHLRLVLAIVSLGGVLLAAALGLLVSRAAMVPVRRLTRATRRVARTSDLGHRIHGGGSDELGELAASFNEMLAALERSRLAQRALISDASHELRTPLTAVRANLDALASGRLDDADRSRAVESARDQLAELTVLVGDLVDLSKTGLDAEEVEDVRLDLAVAATVERVRMLAGRSPDGAADRVIALDADPCLVRGAPAQLDRAVANLLDNACKWSPPGEPIEVSVRHGCVRVRDHGPGFTPEDLPHVFDRFYRARAARALPGSGLGLAIVRQFAELHGGSATAENHPGGGAELTLQLPPSPPAEPDRPSSATAVAA